MSDLWSTSSISMTTTSEESGAGMASRPITYDPSLIWDPDTGTWVTDVALLAAGGGRYHQQIVMIGRDSSGYGRIYYG